MSGETTLKKLKEDPTFNIPVIAVTLMQKKNI